MANSGEASPPILPLSELIQSSPSSMLSTPSNEQNTGKNMNSSLDGLESQAEPLSDDEVAQFRARIAEIGLEMPADGSMSVREKELLQMVTRLIEAPRPNSSQLEQQANAISELLAQRDYMTQQIVDERTRMESEREGFERAAEALIRQRNTKHVYPARYEEQETQIRLTCLEAELCKLKPLLLMQPFPSINTLAHTTSYLSSISYPSLTGSAAVSAEKARLARKRKREKEKAATQEREENGDGESNDTSSQPKEISSGTRPVVGSSGTDLNDSNGTSTPSIYHHLLRPSRNSQPQSQTAGTSSSKPKSQRQRSKSPQHSNNITSDARAELYVLAARKIGRERAAHVSGLITAEREREKERVKAAEEEIAKERLAGGHTGHYRNHTSAGGGSKKGKGKASASAQQAAIPTSPPQRNASAAATGPRTPKQGSASLMPGMQVFTHPGSPHTYMFVPNANMISYPHMHTPPPGAARIVALAAPYSGPGANGMPSVPNQAHTSEPSQTHRPPVSASAGKSATESIATLGESSSTAGPSKTPLASLLSVARSMLDDKEDDSSASSQRPNKRSTTKRKSTTSSEQQGSSTQKRRKVSSGNTEGNASTKSAAKRTRSALDVLADQAAAFSQDHEDSRQSGSSRKGKGKAKAPEDSAREEPESETEIEPSPRVAPRRSVRSTRGRRSDMLKDSVPRMISPAPTREVRRKVNPPEQSSNTAPSLLPPPTITVSGSRSPAEEGSKSEDTTRLESVPARVKRLHGNQDPSATEGARSKEPLHDTTPTSPIQDLRMEIPTPQSPDIRHQDNAPGPSLITKTALEADVNGAEHPNAVDIDIQPSDNPRVPRTEVAAQDAPPDDAECSENPTTQSPSVPVDTIPDSQPNSVLENGVGANNEDADADGDSDPEA
ncbi:hypothetical protein VNI00_002831 [Paramarasmius palmivorus]|uniref:Uncharacterized protein n=1 Tax=Paramarasmius palmivorus TaxID=297713 RepID=A0AAW0DYQ9_9AGAR